MPLTSKPGIVSPAPPPKPGMSSCSRAKPSCSAPGPASSHAPPPPKPGTNASSSSSAPAASGGFSPPPENTELASPGRSRHQNRVVWSLDAVTRMCPSGWNCIDHTFESCACESVARGAGCTIGAAGVVGVMGSGVAAADRSQ